MLTQSTEFVADALSSTTSPFAATVTVFPRECKHLPNLIIKYLDCQFLLDYWCLPINIYPIQVIIEIKFEILKQNLLWL